MPDPRPVNGHLHVEIKVAPDGVAHLFVQWPDGSGWLLPKEQAVQFGLRVLGQARNLFRTMEELEQALLSAKAAEDAIAAGPQPIAADPRPVVQ